MIYRRFKRVFDFTSSLLLITALALPITVIALLVRVALGSPVLFRQERMGMGKKSFTIYKFRTMSLARNPDGELMPDQERLTKLGSFLRSASLDELPELFCILKGSMSVIGPRPLPVDYLPYFTERELLRFTVRCGLIPPEVRYSSTMPTWDEQLSWDVEYAEKLSPKLDAGIFLSVFRSLSARNKKDYGKYARPSLPEEREKRQAVI
jgi:undecaprenyl phosphate N,N'-diacetylbacillosamine 1-phosphate transferase